MINDAHCHFFSTPFFAPLGGDAALTKLGWDAPGTAEALADRWVAELDRHQVSRAALIASVPGDAASVAVGGEPASTAVRRLLHGGPDAGGCAGHGGDGARATRACARSASSPPCTATRCRTIAPGASSRWPRRCQARRCSCTAACCRSACASGSGCRARSTSASATRSICTRSRSRYPEVPIVIPHFGAGMLREALMVADLCPNVVLDTSSSNGWMKYRRIDASPTVFRQALSVVGPDRLLFGSDSSFFPRGWVARRLRAAVGRARRDRRQHGGAGEDLRRQFRAALSNPDARVVQAFRPAVSWQT